MKNFLVLDLETTGLSEITDDPVEVGYALFENVEGELKCKKVGQYFCKLNKRKTIPAISSSVHNITDEDLVGVEESLTDNIKIILQEINYNDIKDDLVLVAHNASFDRKWLDSSLKELGVEHQWVDTLKYAFEVKNRYSLENCKNGYLRYALNLNSKVKETANKFEMGNLTHRAGFDCIITGYILDFFIKKGVLDPSGNIQEPESRITFGKHSGKKWSEVPADYLSFIINNFSSKDLVETARKELQSRK